MMIGITGASGNLGKATLEFLLQKTDASRLVAVVRNPETMKTFADAGVQIRVADYEDPAALEQAFTGVHKLLQVSASGMGEAAARQEKNVVDAASKQGIKHIIYTSTVRPENNRHFLSAKQCLATENNIAASGMAYTFFRNSMYLETIPQFIGGGLYDGQIYFPAGEGKVSFVSRRDIAEALALVLTSNGHENKAYEITGGESISFHDLARVLGTEKNMPALYTDIPEELLKEQLMALPMPTAEVDWFLTLARSVKHNEFSLVDPRLQLLLQRQPMSLTEYIHTI